MEEYVVLNAGLMMNRFSKYSNFYYYKSTYGGISNLVVGETENYFLRLLDTKKKIPHFIENLNIR